MRCAIGFLPMHFEIYVYARRKRVVFVAVVFSKDFQRFPLSVHTPLFLELIYPGPAATFIRTSSRPTYAGIATSKRDKATLALARSLPYNILFAVSGNLQRDRFRSLN